MFCTKLLLGRAPSFVALKVDLVDALGDSFMATTGVSVTIRAAEVSHFCLRAVTLLVALGHSLRARHRCVDG